MELSMDDATATGPVLEVPVEDQTANVDDGGADKSTAPHAEGNLSKRQLRKLKKKENTLKYRPEKRLRERENRKRRRQELREQGEDPGPSKKQLKKNTMANSACKIRVAIDCGFDHMMAEKDIMKLTQQLGYSYSANRRAADPLQLHVTSVGGQMKSRLDKIGDYSSWDVHFIEKDYLSAFDKESIVYLSSDSDNVLSTLEEDKVYVIGGLVDHNHHKGLCHELAVSKGVKHAQLPIGEYIELKSRKVLTVNHVFEILLRYTESHDWEKAFFQVLPKRKGVACKPHSSPGDADPKGTSSSSIVLPTEDTTQSELVHPQIKSELETDVTPDRTGGDERTDDACSLNEVDQDVHRTQQFDSANQGCNNNLDEEKGDDSNGPQSLEQD